MTYLDLVIKETLRMFPIGATITRSLDCDFPLTGILEMYYLFYRKVTV